MKTILFQGDSITDCGRTYEDKTSFVNKLYYKIHKRTPMGDGYPLLVSEALDAESPGSFKFINRGVGGDRIPNVYARIVKDIINIRPDYMSLLVGINDVWRNYDCDSCGTGVERFEKVYNILIEEIKAELPETKIMILEPFLLEGPATGNRPDQPERYNNFRRDVRELAEITRKIADKHNLKFIELQSVFDQAAVNTPTTDLLSDGVHPTAAGHELIKKEWLKAFREIG